MYESVSESDLTYITWKDCCHWLWVYIKRLHYYNPASGTVLSLLVYVMCLYPSKKCIYLKYICFIISIVKIYWHIYWQITRDLRSSHTESEMFACVFSYSSSFPIKMHGKRRKSNLIQIFYDGRKLMSWHNVRSYLFFNLRKFQMKISKWAETFTVIKVIITLYLTHLYTMHIS